MTSHILTDNSNVSRLANHPIVKNLVNKDLSLLSKENFLIFPQQLSESYDLDNDNVIFHQKNDAIWTGNVVGIIGDGTSDIRINSRFTKEGQQDFFLRYMMQQVLHYNVVDSKNITSQEISYYDLLLFLFPYYLNEALRKGTYKEYVKKSYNDSNVKGPIEIASHIRKNLPFVGKIAYTTREFNYDNQMTELIRHTIEKIQQEKEFLLTDNENTKENVRTIKSMTASYNRLDREIIIQKNILNPVKSGYFEEYALLQRLCLKILTEEKTGFGDDENQIHGIIIDVAWLWEEYIWKITQWHHYGRKAELDTLGLFSQPINDNQQHRYPDFAFRGIPIDTKYKRNIDKRNDYNQIITYLHIMASQKGGFLQPTDVENDKGLTVLGELFGGGELFSYKFFIPQEYSNYEDFVLQIRNSEKALKVLSL
ncbi:5-methylcytosine restriction system specificity protein McrC [Streptococcus pacificus]|uniref:Guanosine 5'-monophosphate oxidoreductase n=1 Tax=Streptococcus pacificus TaxID=2740577 RepID=A0ABS0ZKF9_9STRE|nr:guanosine 5'-monophosphate oxidoreductase [Streptococcus pacificus]MBJ8326208.1 guanosine 5'-monophosphate oxidoreductase [Streptococcus pacificus]